MALPSGYDLSALKDLSMNAPLHIAFTGDNYNNVNVGHTDIQIGLIIPPCPLLITPE